MESDSLIEFREVQPVPTDNNYPLHDLAFNGDHEEMKILFREDRTESQRQILRKDNKGRTPLHYAALTENLEGGEACVKALVEFHQTLKSIPEWEETDVKTTEQIFKQFPRQRRKTPQQLSIDGCLKLKEDIAQRTKKFINQKDNDKETALSLAAKNENPKVVEYLLQNSANVLSTCGNERELTLELIYSNTPSAVTSLLDQSVTFDYGDKNKENVTVKRKYIFDLSAIVGNSEFTTHLTEYTEAELLHSVNNKSHQSRNKILEHPLVQLFISMKRQNMKYFFWISLLFHITWVGLYIWLAVDVYSDCCDCSKVAKNITCVRYPFENWTNHQGKNNMALKKLNEVFIASLKKSSVIARPIIILLLSIVVFCKEIYRIIFLKLNYVAVKIIFIWAFFIALALTGWPHRTDVTVFTRQFQLAAFGIIIGGQIILHRVTKYTYLAIYMKVLTKQFERFLATLPLFFIIMLTFATSLGMLYPDLHLSTSASVYHFRDSLMRVFEAITTSKVEWSSLYKDSTDQNFKISGLIMYVAFYSIIILILFKMLLGFVVADTKRIQDEERVESISDDLEFIFIIESFLFSKLFNKLCRQFNIFSKFREIFVLSKLNNETRNLRVSVSEKEIPQLLRKKIRRLASKNLLNNSHQSKSKVLTEN